MLGIGWTNEYPLICDESALISSRLCYVNFFASYAVFPYHTLFIKSTEIGVHVFL